MFFEDVMMDVNYYATDTAESSVTDTFLETLLQRKVIACPTKVIVTYGEYK